MPPACRRSQTDIDVLQSGGLADLVENSSDEDLSIFSPRSDWGVETKTKLGCTDGGKQFLAEVRPEKQDDCDRNDGARSNHQPARRRHTPEEMGPPVSKLVEQRPDVRQAEENLHSASAQIGVAIANRLPNIALTADAGSMAVVLGHLFTPGTGFWDVGASVTQPIFEGGTLLHRERAAQAAYTEAAEQYRSTVLTAFQNVADTLHALQQDADALKAAAAAVDAAKVTLDLTTRQLQAGYVNYLSLLSAEQSYQQALLNLAQAQANRYADTAALFQALGGGWWNRADIPKN